ncbi:ribonuclease HI family protein [Rugamonas sp. DEMB1]|uniref:ribonuclease HI family protein n=1 Tax=Rugamonas sp. DEMB1 TaxID=3039386 RepID=UPI0024480C1C|nr:ribonuclease HI family protein [Rugamonas sp. DEMB1]WGG52524.1 ribonuclease HI family protein [Rugamonas sp. DEMB1]
MPTEEFDRLAAAAYKGERTSGRRLAARGGVSELDALRQTLTLAAGAAGLDQLLTARAQLRQSEQDRRAAKLEVKAAALAQKRARAQPAPGAWQAWFDGSAHPNPGRLGIGALLCGPQGQRVEISRRAGHGNSGEAEYLALIALLEAAQALRPPQLLVYGDSQVVINDVNQPAAPAAKGLEPHRARVAELLAGLGEVSLRWIPRHRNGAADGLSQQAIASWPAALPGEPADWPTSSRS